ncbi:MAG TPA: thioesterase family protein [Thermoanaerobaculia bacterium]|jgi:acyl-CoA thioesterase FadM
MVLVFRFLFSLVRALFRARVGVHDESVLKFVCMPTDCDLNLHMNAGRYVSFMDLGRVEFIGRSGALLGLARRKWRPIAGGSMLSYRRSVLPFERFTLRSRILCWDEKWFYFEHVIENARGEFCASGVMRALLRGPGASIPTRDVLAVIGIEDQPSPPMPPFVAKWIEAEALR